VLLNTLTNYINFDCLVGIISRVNTALGTLRRAWAGMFAERRHEGVSSMSKKNRLLLLVNNHTVCLW